VLVSITVDDMTLRHPHSHRRRTS